MRLQVYRQGLEVDPSSQHILSSLAHLNVGAARLHAWEEAWVLHGILLHGRGLGCCMRAYSSNAGGH